MAIEDIKNQMLKAQHEQAQPRAAEGFEPNWKRAGLPSVEYCIAYILEFLKKNEKSIINRGVDSFHNIMVGNYSFMLGKIDGKKDESKRVAGSKEETD